MATAKRRGAPASTKRERQPGKKKPPKAERSAEFRKKQADMQAMLDDEIENTGAVWKQNPHGNAFKYTDTLGQRISDLIVAGYSIMRISKEEGMPSDVTMFRWIADKAHPLSDMYMRAKEILVARYEEEIQEIADTPVIGMIRVLGQRVTKDGEIVNVQEKKYADNIEHRKLQIATRQWTLGHLRPKKHGRNPDNGANAPNEQLTALFDSLKAGPVKRA